MSFKLKSIVFFLAVFVAIGISSCEEEPAAPTISGLEVGENNSKTATIGDELHLDAEIVAEGEIDKIEVELHSEDGTGEDIDESFDNYSGQKNADFHEHIEIPATAVAGEYHFHLKVTDKEGQVTEAEADVDIQ